MAETGCGDPPTEKNSSDPVKQQLSDVEDGRVDLVAKVAQLESQIEDVTTTLRDETENRRLVQHELESSNFLCQKLEHALQSQKIASSSGDRLPSQHEQGMQTDNKGTENERDVSRQTLGKKMRNYSAASLLVEEYKSNQQSLELQVKRLSQECSAKDGELSRVGQKCAQFIQKNAQLEAGIESMRDELSKKQRLMDQKEAQLRETEASLEEKMEMMKKLKVQRDTLSGKFYRAKRQASKLKEVVVSFNKTVAEFRKEREQMANRTVSTRGMAVKDIMDDHHKDADADDSSEGGNDQATHPDTPTNPGSKGTSPESDHQASQEDGSWSRGPDEVSGHPLLWSSDDDSDSQDSCIEIPSSIPQEQGSSGPSHKETRSGGHRAKQQREGRRLNHTWHHEDVEWGGHSFLKGPSEVLGPRGNGHRVAAREQHHGPQRAVADRTPTPFGDISADKDCSFDTAADLSNSLSQGSEEDAWDYRHGTGRPTGVHSHRLNVKGAARHILLEGASSKEDLPSSHDAAEGLFLVKHEMENYATRAADRSWNFVYIRHVDDQVWFYENRDFATLGLTLDGMDPLDLSGAIVCPLRDYAKRSHVFCIQLTSGARYLFQARDEMDMLYWTCRLSSGTGDMSLGQDCFPQGSAPTRSSPSKTDRLKNFVRGGISSIWK